MSLYEDYNYLLEGGFKLNKLNNRKYGYYYSRNDTNIELLIFIKNSLKYYLKNQFNIRCINNICPDETYIITQNDKIIIKIIDKISHKNIKNVPYKKKEYEMMFSYINNFKLEYGIIINNNNIKIEKNFKEILASYDIEIFNINNEYHYDNIDKWLDKH
uniref:Uncharacterized protein n=1 Tax=viral metagenome TaxID=1070528 RepID=A0A6C0J549_9ZZZZ